MKNKKNRISLLNFEGDVFTVVRQDSGGFSVVDCYGTEVVTSASHDHIMDIYDGKVMLTTTEGRLYDISKEHKDAKPSRNDLIVFLSYGKSKKPYKGENPKNFGLSFNLSDKQQKEFDEWKSAIKKIHGEYGSFEWTIIPTGIGNGLVVYSKLTKTKLDLTDMDSW